MTEPGRRASWWSTAGCHAAARSGRRGRSRSRTAPCCSAALAEGTSVVHGLSDGADVGASLAAVEAMGVAVERADDGTRTVVLHGGRSQLHQPGHPLDCGNSGTSMRLLTGLVAGLPWRTELVGDESLSKRPMDRVAEPLDQMGAAIEGHGERCLPPLRVRGGSLRGVDWTSRVASAQVKSAILLAGLSAEGATVVREAVTTRTHTEEMLAEAGADITVEPWGEGRVVTVRPSTLKPVERTVPGDPSAAAFFAVAGAVVPGSAVDVADVYRGPARLGFVSVLERMGADVTLVPGGDTDADDASRAGIATIRVKADPAAAEGDRRGRRRDPLARRGPHPRRGRGRRPGHHGVLRRRRAAGQGGGPPGGGGRHGRGVRGDRAHRGRHAGHHGRRRPAARRALRQPRRPPHGHGCGGGRPGRGARRAEPDHGLRRGGHQLPRLRRRPGSPHDRRGADSGARRTCPARVARRHRRPRGRRQVHGLEGRGQPSRRRPSRHGRHVPRRRGARPRAWHRGRRRRGRGAARRERKHRGWPRASA